MSADSHRDLFGGTLAPGRYALVGAHVSVDPHLHPIPLRLLLILRHLAAARGWVVVRTADLRELHPDATSSKTIQRALAELARLGYIAKRQTQADGLMVTVLPPTVELLERCYALGQQDCGVQLAPEVPHLVARQFAGPSPLSEAAQDIQREKSFNTDPFTNAARPRSGQGWLPPDPRILAEAVAQWMGLALYARTGRTVRPKGSDLEPHLRAGIRVDWLLGMWTQWVGTRSDDLRQISKSWRQVWQEFLGWYLAGGEFNPGKATRADPKDFLDLKRAAAVVRQRADPRHLANSSEIPGLEGADIDALSREELIVLTLLMAGRRADGDLTIVWYVKGSAVAWSVLVLTYCMQNQIGCGVFEILEGVERLLLRGYLPAHPENEREPGEQPVRSRYEAARLELGSQGVCPGCGRPVDRLYDGAEDFAGVGMRVEDSLCCSRCVVGVVTRLSGLAGD